MIIKMCLFILKNDYFLCLKSLRAIFAANNFADVKLLFKTV